VTDLTLRVVTAFLAGLVLVPVSRALATRFGIVARPSAGRWHKHPTPLLGGVAIASIVIAGGLTIEPFSRVALTLTCGALVACLGFADDLRDLKSSTKLVFQIVVAAVFVYAGHRLHWANSLTIDTLLTLVWIVGITNALNLLDNMDGLAAGVGIVACVSLLLTVAGNSPAEAQLLATLLGALVAFLVFNAHPASIFMGDTGSLFTGLVLAAVSVVAGNSAGPRELLSVVAAPVMVLFIPIFDMAFVVVARILSGRAPVEGGRDHSSHRLVAMGLSEPAAVAVLWVLAAIGGLIGVGVRLVSTPFAGVIAGAFVIGMALFAAYLAGVRVYDDGPAVQNRGLTPVVVNFMHKRRVLEVLLDLSLVCMAYYSAYRLRFDRSQFDTAFPYFLKSLPIVIAGQIPVLLALGAYRGMWRHFGLMDALVVGKSVALGTLASVALVAWLNDGLPMPGAVFVIYAALLLLLLTGSRASFRLMTEFISRRASGRRVVIYASSQDEQFAVHRLATSGDEPRRVLGFFEDSHTGGRTSVEGYPILGDYGDLLDLIAAGRTDVVIACVKNIQEGRLDELMEHCSVYSVALVKFRYTLEAVTKKFEVLQV
jgi:UDP-GlcNAc:undecaprenyl-phosphate GlcNAc-1-phosphate transferase